MNQIQHERVRKRDREKETFHPMVHSSRGSQWLELCQAKSRSQPLHLDLPGVSRDPNTCAIFHCFPSTLAKVCI